MARLYSHAGWKIFPLWPAHNGRCTCRQGRNCTSPGKHPLYPPAHRKAESAPRCYGTCGKVGHGVYDATVDPNINATRWAAIPDAGIGLAAHGNGLAVIDVDPRHGGDESFTQLNAYALSRGVDLTTTLAQHTGGGGVQYLYAAPDGGIKSGSKTFGADLPGVDTRGRGGYIVAPPTWHASGHQYRWVDWGADIAPWPQCLSALIDPPATAQVVALPSVPRTPGGGYAEAALAAEITAVRATTEGNRNNRLNVAAFNLGQLVAAGHLDRGTVERELVAAGLATGLKEPAVRATVRSGLSGGHAKPRVAA